MARATSYSDYKNNDISSLWRESKSFRKLTYATILLFILVVFIFTSKLINHASKYSSLPQAQYTPPPSIPNRPPGSPTHPAAFSPQRALPVQNTVDSYPIASSTWGDTLNPRRDVISNGFDVYYINTNQPRSIIARSQVKNIGINYSWSNLHGIPSEDFGAYWVGKIIVPETALYQFALHQSNAKTRIIVDKHIIFESSNNTPPTLELDAGMHLIEVEYINNWHTTTFQLSIEKAVTTFQSTELRAAMDALKLPANTTVHTVSAYDSKDVDNRISIQSTAVDPYVLVLSSYKAVKWSISGTAPRAVIYNQSKIGSTVGASGQPPILAWNGSLNFRAASTSQASACQCMAGRLHCPDGKSDLQEISNQILQWTGFPLSTVSGAYSSAFATVPGTALSTQLTLNQQQQQLIDAQRKRCTTQQATGFENMMSQEPLK